ncbi:MAG: hypothetical protein ABIM74_04655 [candidate division WOR-3 bacterium]
MIALLLQVNFPVFARVYGGQGDDWVYSMVSCPDGGFVLAGYTRGFGSRGADVLVVKMGFTGEPEWATAAGGPGSEYANSVIRTIDGGFVVAGYTRSFGSGGADALIMKLGPDGELDWARVIGGAGNDCINSLLQMPDGDLLLAGYTTSYGSGGSDMLLLRLNHKGEVVWAKTIGGPGSESITSLVAAHDAGFLLLGYGPGPLLVCLDPSMEIIWARYLDMASGYIQSGLAIPDGFLLSGWARSKRGDPDALVLRLNEKGRMIWAKRFGGSGYDWASSIVELPDEGFGVAGCISFGHYNFLVLGLSDSGELIWAKTFGSPGWDAASCILQTNDGGITLAGYTSGFGIGGDDILVLRLGPHGWYPGCVVDCPLRIATLSAAQRNASLEARPCSPTTSAPEIAFRRIAISALDVCPPPLEESDGSTDQ